MVVGTGEVPPLEARANAFDYATSDGLWSSGNENVEDDFALTGIGFGVGLGVLISATYSAKSKYFKSASQVALPGGMKFQLFEEE